MKHASLPYFSVFLLLTIAFGLMGNAKLLLAVKLESTKVTIASPLINPPKKNSVTKLARERSTQAILDTFAKISIEPESEQSTAKITSTETQKTVAAEENTAEKKQPQELTSTANLSEMPSIDLLNKLEDSMQTQLAPKRFSRAESPVIANRFFTNEDLAYQAELRLQSNVTYDGRYLKIGYPMGDVPQNMGVCTDVVIRSLRGLGIDLQQRVHEDMKRNFRSYPNKWQLSRPDSNIDHRRVPNLMTYFKRAGASLRISNNPADYHPGNIVAWEMGNGMTHIGIVSTSVSAKSGNPLIVHNIGVGPELSDILFDFKIIGHYKFGRGRDRNSFEPRMAAAQTNPLHLISEDFIY